MPANRFDVASFCFMGVFSSFFRRCILAFYCVWKRLKIFIYRKCNMCESNGLTRQYYLFQSFCSCEGEPCIVLTAICHSVDPYFMVFCQCFSSCIILFCIWYVLVLLWSPVSWVQVLFYSQTVNWKNFVEYSRISRLEGTHNKHLVQLPSHFRTDQKLKHGFKDIV